MPNPNPEIIEVMAEHSVPRLRAIIAELEQQRDVLVDQVLDSEYLSDLRRLQEDLKTYGKPLYRHYFRSNSYKVPGR